jgi:DNA repair exonuclease SbcCD ATPase subunit
VEIMPVKRPGEKATKAQIMEAFDQLEAERKALETENKKLQSEVKAKNDQTPVVTAVKMPVNEPIKKEEKTMNQTTVIQPVINDKMNYTLDILGKLQLGFGSTISELSEKLTTEANKLSELRSFVSKEIEELQELHNLEVTENSLDTLIEEYQTSAKTFTEEFSTRKETLEQETLELKKSWQKEQEEQQKTIKERNQNQSKLEQRDQEEYEYELQLTRELEEEQYALNQQRLYQELADIKQAQEKEWTEKEKAIADQEKQQKEAKEKVESFEKERESAIKKAKDEGKGIGNYQAKIKSDMVAKEMEGQKRLYEQRITSLEETININLERIANLSKQLESAQKQAQDLAVKAIEGAANMNSLQTFKELAMEQAKSQSKAK